MKLSPSVTVLMPVYNSEAYLRETIESILSQTFTNFEFLVINDGSTDKTEEILKSIDDKRVRILKNKINMGLIETLNKGLYNSRGNYIARMDADDIMYPDRLKRQFEFLKKHNEVDICGTAISVFGENLKTEVFKYPTSHDDIICAFLRFNPMAHPSVMFRKASIVKTGEVFSSECVWAEDYDFFERLSKRLKFANLSKVLLKYRVHGGQVTKKKKTEMAAGAKKVRYRQLVKLIPDITSDNIQIHEKIIDTNISIYFEELPVIENWLRFLAQRMSTCGHYREEAIINFIDGLWINVCNRTKLTSNLWKKYVSSDLRRPPFFLNRNQWKLFLKCKVKSFR
jgi:glycosyltransferase involved in cell wall biosynthesis